MPFDSDPVTLEGNDFCPELVCSVHADTAFTIPPQSEIIVLGRLNAELPLKKTVCSLVVPRNDLPHRYSMQKPYSNSSHRGAGHSQKRNFSRFKPYHYNRTRGSGNKSTNRQPFLGARPPINTVPEKAGSQQQQLQQQKLASSSC